MYEEGNNYGSNILNHEKNPTITIKVGRDAEIKPIIVDGKIVDAVVLNRGKDWTSSLKNKMIGPDTQLGKLVNSSKFKQKFVI